MFSCSPHTFCSARCATPFLHLLSEVCTLSGPRKSVNSLLFWVSFTQASSSETYRSFKCSTMVRKQEENKLGCAGGRPNCLLAVISQSPLTVLLFFYILGEVTHLTPPTPLFLPSPYRPFLCPATPLPPSAPLSACLLTQTLNLLEPRDPVCYVNQFNADTHVNARAPNVHTNSYGPCACVHMRLRACARTYSRRAIWSKLGSAAFLAGVQLSTIAHRLMQCLQELPVTTKSKAFPSELRTVGG